MKFLLVLLASLLAANAETTATIECRPPEGELCAVTQVPEDADLDDVELLTRDPQSVRVVQIENVRLPRIPATVFNFRGLESLIVAHCALEDPPPRFTPLPRLREVSLRGNHLRQLEPGTFAELTLLTDIDLAQNEFIDIGPRAFLGIRAAGVHVDLSFNGLGRLDPGTFRQAAFVGVRLRANALHDVEGVFNGLTELRVLDLGHNQLDAISAATFDDARQLETLLLDNNRIEAIDPEAFASLEQLRVLDLAYNRIETLSLKLNSADLLRVSVNRNRIGNDLVLVSNLDKVNIGILQAQGNKIEGIIARGDFEIGWLNLDHNRLVDPDRVVNLWTVARFDRDHNRPFNRLPLHPELARLLANHTDTARPLAADDH